MSEYNKDLEEIRAKLPLKLRYPYVLCKDRIELGNVFSSWYKYDYFQTYGFTKHHFGPNANGLATFPILLTTNCTKRELILTYLHEVGHLVLDEYKFGNDYRVIVRRRIGKQYFTDSNDTSKHEAYINKFVKVWSKKLNIHYWGLHD